jgi:hypothetical protein
VQLFDAQPDPDVHVSPMPVPVRGAHAVVQLLEMQLAIDVMRVVEPLERPETHPLVHVELPAHTRLQFHAPMQGESAVHMSQGSLQLVAMHARHDGIGDVTPQVLGATL